MKEIELFTGELAIIDDEDFERVSQHKWHRTIGKSGIVYARRQEISDNKVINISLHGFILSNTTTLEIDHKNRNGLDNRKCNLRLATHQQNSWNRGVNGKIQYKGVSAYKNRKSTYRAQIRMNDKITYLGCFKTPEAAALAYDKKAYEIQGEFAYLNVPEMFIEII
jgi:hypothetical protein